MGEIGWVAPLYLGAWRGCQYNVAYRDYAIRKPEATFRLLSGCGLQKEPKI
jgi:hypothetical protein